MSAEHARPTDPAPARTDEERAARIARNFGFSAHLEKALRKHFGEVRADERRRVDSDAWGEVARVDEDRAARIAQTYGFSAYMKKALRLHFGEVRTDERRRVEYASVPRCASAERSLPE